MMRERQCHYNVNVPHLHCNGLYFLAASFDLYCQTSLKIEFITQNIIQGFVNLIYL